MEDLGLVGFIFFLLGGLFIAFAFGFIRFFPKPVFDDDPISCPEENPSNGKALVVIASGGRVSHINRFAREWFGVLEKNPGLERLAKQTRPTGVFLELCSGTGEGSFSIHGHRVKGESIELSQNGSRTVVVSIQKHQPGSHTRGVTLSRIKL
jgi:hypothetical protein